MKTTSHHERSSFIVADYTIHTRCDRVRVKLATMDAVRYLLVALAAAALFASAFSRNASLMIIALTAALALGAALARIMSLRIFSIGSDGMTRGRFTSRFTHLSKISINVASDADIAFCMDDELVQIQCTSRLEAMRVKHAFNNARIWCDDLSARLRCIRPVHDGYRSNYQLAMHLANVAPATYDPNVRLDAAAFLLQNEHELRPQEREILIDSIKSSVNKSLAALLPPRR